ncbi:MAG TPA: hypothetical protein VLW85_15110 [Myxococcales bacterium]|nr:hypothetical protein [Myxococcales bacterium]
MRAWLFRLVSVVLLPLLALALFEGALHLFGFGAPAGFTIPCEIDGRAAFCENPEFTAPFFPAGMERRATPFAIPAQKAPGTLRVFVVGESAAMGDPDPAFGLSRFLEVMLRAQFPGRRVEVINAGVVAINSHALLPIVGDLSRLQPDVFVIYAGNNEVVGPWGTGTVFTRGAPPLRLIRLFIRARQTRLGQLVSRVASLGRRPQQWAGMEMFLGHQESADDPALRPVYANFAANLRDMIDAARSSGARVLVSTVPTRLRDFAPFAGEQALAEYRAGHLVAARDLDTLRFRADSRINAIIREVAGPLLVDGEAALGAAPGAESFWEHVHLTPRGNYALASVFFRGIAGAPPLAEDACEQRLALTGFDRYRIAREVLRRLEHPPFTGQADHAQQVAAVEAVRDDGAREEFDATDAAYRAAIAAWPDDPWLHYDYAVLLDTRDVFFARRGGRDEVRAIPQYEAALRLLPQWADARYRFSRALLRAGRPDDAAAQCRVLLSYRRQYDACGSSR